MKNKKVNIKEIWIKPEVKELDVNKTANATSVNSDGSLLS